MASLQWIGKEAVVNEGGKGGGSPGASPLFGEPVAEVVTAQPSSKVIAALPKDVREAVSFQTRADTKETEIVWSGGC
jgi:hypothetical protein